MIRLYSVKFAWDILRSLSIITLLYTHHFEGSITPNDCGCVSFELGSHWTKLGISDVAFAYVSLSVNELSLGECGYALAKMKYTWTTSVNAPLGTSLVTTRRSVWTLLNDDISLSPYNAIPLFCASRCVHFNRLSHIYQNRPLHYCALLLMYINSNRVTTVNFCKH